MRLLVIGGVDGQVALALSRIPASRMDAGGDEIVIRGRPELDMLDPASMTKAIDDVKPDAVACVGAFTAVDLAETERDLAMRLNADAPAHLARECATRGLPIVHVSTDYVFNGAKPGLWVETDAPDPKSVYGATKLAGEQGVQAAGGRHAILRTSWVFASEGKNFVRTMLRMAGARDRLTVVDDQIGHPTYAPFIADTILAVARRMTSDKAAPSGVYHMVGEGVTSWCGFANAIFEGSRTRGGPFAVADPIPTSAYHTPASRPLNSALDTSKLARDYGLRLPHWREGLSQCLDAIARDGWKVG